MKPELKLGEKAKDTASGLTGIITGRAEYIDGRIDFCIQPACDGPEYNEAQWFAAGRIEHAS